MHVGRDIAEAYDAVRLDSFEVVNRGKLIEADDQTGVVSWFDRTGAAQAVKLGPHAIRVVLKGKR